MMDLTTATISFAQDMERCIRVFAKNVGLEDYFDKQLAEHPTAELAAEIAGDVQRIIQEQQCSTPK